MIYYSAAFLFYYACVVSAFQDVRKHENKIFIFGMLPLVLLVVLRGDVGTDTASYLQIISGIQDTGEAVSGHARTPISGWGEFTAIIKGLFYFTTNPRVIVAVLALFTTGILIYASLISEKAKWVFAVCVVPIFYLDMTMNGLRYGLAFAIAAYAIYQSYRGHWIVSGLLQAVAVFMHSTTLALFVITWLLASTSKQKKYLLITGLLVCVVFSFQTYLSKLAFEVTAVTPPVTAVTPPVTTVTPPVTTVTPPVTTVTPPVTTVTPPVTAVTPPVTAVTPPGSEQYWSEKYTAYSRIKSPSLWSGFAPLILSLGVLLLMQYSNPPSRVLRRYQFMALLGLIVLTFAIAKLSYAGLRMQYIVLFAIFANMQYKPEFNGLMEAKKARTGLLVLGLVGLAFFMRGVINTEGIGPSPFLPYVFNPDIFPAESLLKTGSAHSE
jgi:hypothetical protein